MGSDLSYFIVMCVVVTYLNFTVFLELQYTHALKKENVHTVRTRKRMYRIHVAPNFRGLNLS